MIHSHVRSNALGLRMVQVSDCTVGILPWFAQQIDLAELSAKYNISTPIPALQDIDLAHA